MPSIASESGHGPTVCRICGEVLTDSESECPKCGCPVSVSINDQIASARDRVMSLARSMPGIAQNATDVDSLCQQFLRVVVSATSAVHGAVWNLDSDDHWRHPDKPLPIAFFEAPHRTILGQVDHDLVIPPDAPTNHTDFMLVLRPFSTPAIARGVVELAKRGDAPTEAAAGYKMFLDQMAGYFENSPVLQAT